MFVYSSTRRFAQARIQLATLRACTHDDWNCARSGGGHSPSRSIDLPVVAEYCANAPKTVVRATTLGQRGPWIGACFHKHQGTGGGRATATLCGTLVVEEFSRVL